MIVDFTVKNYCSVNEPITLSFVPKAGIKDIPDIYLVCPTEGIHLLKFGSILGANASGKTTLLRSLEVLRMLVCDPYGNKTRRLPFYAPYWFSPHIEKPSELAIRFVASGYLFQYFVSFNSECITLERLRIFDKTWRIIYSRETNEDSQTVRIKPGVLYNRYREELKQLETVTLWNNTVLGGSLKISINIPELHIVTKWFHDYLYPMIDPDTNLYGYVSSLIDQGKIDKSRLLKYLGGADLMIEDLVVKKDTWENLDERMKMQLIERNQDMSLEEIKEKFPVRHVEFIHSNGERNINVDYVDESLGTQRFYQLCGVLDMLLNQKCMFFVDEIDNSIHPDLLEYLLITFLLNSKESQLLISTHHREWLMQEDYVRPDSVWFTEKQSDGSTQLYRLSDFIGIKNDKRILSYYEAYRKGLLGATPPGRSFFLNTDSDDKNIEFE